MLSYGMSATHGSLMNASCATSGTSPGLLTYPVTRLTTCAGILHQQVECIFIATLDPFNQLFVQ